MNKEDYFKYYIQGSDHYLIPKDIFDELYDEMNNWKQDAQKYKEVIDSAKALVNNVYNSLENADKPIKFYEELLDILNINERI